MVDDAREHEAKQNAAILTDRIRRGLSTIVLGAVPALPPSIALLRVRCDLPGTLGPLERARDRIERSLDGDMPRETLEASARRRALGEEGLRTIEERFVAACNRLAARAPGRVALALDGIDRADAATHRALAHLLRKRGVLALPLVLVVRGEPEGSFLEVVSAMEAAASEPPPLARAPEAEPEREVRTPALQLDGIDGEVVRVLRAASVIGEAFEAPLVAKLLDASIEHVLEALQRARDAGIRIVDRGEGHLAMPRELAAMLGASILPSLRARWQERLGELLGSARHDPLRAAKHLEEAGQRERALERRLDAVALLVRAGDVRRAGEELGNALEAIAGLPPGPATSALQARGTLERARLRWLGAGLEPSFGLDGALEEALSARTALGDLAAPAVRADVASTIAGIAYDLGDGASLARAGAVLTDAIASLLRDGATREAAMLLNDQAAVHLRSGNTRKARELAARSLELLSARVKEAPGDAAARADLADTNHLLARMPLHVPSGEVSADVLEAALAHADAAESDYRALSMRRDLGRVRETTARLEAKRGHIDAARTAFEAALRLADEAADLTGLARITAGLAELLAGTGKPRDALGLLASSIELNREKASPIGLAFDERALTRIEDAVRALPRPDDELAAELVRTRARLTEAIEENAP